MKIPKIKIDRKKLSWRFVFHAFYITIIATLLHGMYEAQDWHDYYYRRAQEYQKAWHFCLQIQMMRNKNETIERKEQRSCLPAVGPKCIIKSGEVIGTGRYKVD